MTDRSRARAPGKSESRGGLPWYDQELRAAKNSGRTVKFAMSTDTYFTEPEECTVEGKIEKVDKFDVAIKITPGSSLHDKTIWLKKSQIVGTEVL